MAEVHEHGITTVETHHIEIRQGESEWPNVKRESFSYVGRELVQPEAVTFTYKIVDNGKLGRPRIGVRCTRVMADGTLSTQGSKWYEIRSFGREPMPAFIGEALELADTIMVAYTS